MQERFRKYAMVGLTIALCLTNTSFAQRQRQQEQRTRRSQRVVPMKEVQVASPDGRVKFIVGSNPERLTYAVTLEGTTVIEPSPLDMRMDAYHLSSGVIFNNLESYNIPATYPRH